MLVAGMLNFDSLGRVILSTLPPISFNGGTPIAPDGGLSGAVGAPPEVILAGLGYLSDGNLTNSSNPFIVGEGVLANVRGQVRVSFDAPVVWYAGLPLDANGRLCLSPLAPIDAGAFNSTEFDNAFDIVEP